jgi:hypothetical protein
MLVLRKSQCTFRSFFYIVYVILCVKYVTAKSQGLVVRRKENATVTVNHPQTTTQGIN